MSVDRKIASEKIASLGPCFYFKIKVFRTLFAIDKAVRLQKPAKMQRVAGKMLFQTDQLAARMLKSGYEKTLLLDCARRQSKINSAFKCLTNIHQRPFSSSNIGGLQSEKQFPSTSKVAQISFEDDNEKKRTGSSFVWKKIMWRLIAFKKLTHHEEIGRDYFCWARYALLQPQFISVIIHGPQGLAVLT